MKKVVLNTLLILLSFVPINAQKKELAAEKISVKMKDGAKPDIYVDGKKFDFPMGILDQNKIETIRVIKGKKALQKYNAPNGVVLIKIKKEVEKNVAGISRPMIIIDGKKSDKKTLNKLSPEAIDKITVLKGKRALEKYKAAGGVIIITTKKAAKKH